MTRYVLPAAVVALALGTVLGVSSPAHAQIVAAPPMQPVAMPSNDVSTVNATIYGQPQPGPYDETETYSITTTFGPAYAAPVPPAAYAHPITPRTTWIPSHYEWDPTRSNYVYVEGQYIEAPRENAQWIPGHWVQTPSSWIWIQGTWN